MPDERPRLPPDPVIPPLVVPEPVLPPEPELPPLPLPPVPQPPAGPPPLGLPPNIFEHRMLPLPEMGEPVRPPPGPPPGGRLEPILPPEPEPPDLPLPPICPPPPPPICCPPGEIRVNIPPQPPPVIGRIDVNVLPPILGILEQVDRILEQIGGRFETVIREQGRLIEGIWREIEGRLLAPQPDVQGRLESLYREIIGRLESQIASQIQTIETLAQQCPACPPGLPPESPQPIVIQGQIIGQPAPQPPQPVPPLPPGGTIQVIFPPGPDGVPTPPVIGRIITQPAPNGDGCGCVFVERPCPTPPPIGGLGCPESEAEKKIGEGLQVRKECYLLPQISIGGDVASGMTQLPQWILSIGAEEYRAEAKRFWKETWDLLDRSRDVDDFVRRAYADTNERRWLERRPEQLATIP